MNSIKRLFGYIHESLFLAPKSSYAVLNTLYVSLFCVEAALNSDSPDFGFAVGLFIFYMVILDVAILLLLMWRGENVAAYRTATRRLLAAGLLLVVVVVPIATYLNYNYELERATSERDEWVTRNKEYSQDPDKRFNYSIPQSQIRTDEQLRQDTLNSNLSFAMVLPALPLIFIVPMVVIRLIRTKLLRA